MNYFGTLIFYGNFDINDNYSYVEAQLIPAVLYNNTYYIAIDFPTQGVYPNNDTAWESVSNIATILSVNGKYGNVMLTKADLGLGNVVDVDQTNAANIVSGILADARLSSNVTLQGNIFNGVNQLTKTGADGKLPSSVIPAIAINNVTVVPTEADMLAQVGMLVGDVTTVTSDPTSSKNGTYILTQLPSSSIASWTQLSTGSGVTSVNGQPGPAVVLNNSDIGLSNVQNVDQTNATNITSGTLDHNRLPVGTTTTIGALSVDPNTLTVSALGEVGVKPPTIEYVLFNSGITEALPLTWNYDTTFCKFGAAVVLDNTFTLDVTLDISTLRFGTIKLLTIVNNTNIIGNQVQINVAITNGSAVVYNSIQTYYSFNPRSAITAFLEAVYDGGNSVVITWSQGEASQVNGIDAIISNTGSIICTPSGIGDVDTITSDDNSVIIENTGSGNVSQILSSDDSILINII